MSIETNYITIEPINEAQVIVTAHEVAVVTGKHQHSTVAKQCFNLKAKTANEFELEAMHLFEWIQNFLS